MRADFFPVRAPERARGGCDNGYAMYRFNGRTKHA